ncbi:PH domain-containing protein [Streptomyces sp. NPDC047974]|uniref:PH domain-containing protein n=1 Tax=Streptomyces sp. NPDC047974 TaxID=3154343 RepID=UPI0033EEDC0B
MSASPSLPRTYRIKPGRMTALYVAAGLGLPAALIPLHTEEFVPGWVKWLVTSAVLGFVGWIAYAARNLSTTADRQGIHVRGFFRRRRIAWADVQDIRAVPNPSAAMGQGQPRVISYAYGRGGRRVQLHYLDDHHVHVEREIEALRAVWQRLRGEDWTEDAAAARRIDRRSARESALLTALSWSMFSVLGFTVLFVVLLLTDHVFLGPEWILVGPVLVFPAVWLGASLRGDRDGAGGGGQSAR